MIDATEIRRLWDLLPHPEGSVVRYMARRRVNGQDQGSGEFVENVEELIRAADTWTRDGYNMYVQVNPTRERARSRPRAEDVTHWSWVLIDLDPVGDGPDLDPGLALTTYVHRLSLDSGTLLDPLVLDSGRGMQAWVRLEDRALACQWSTLRDRIADESEQGAEGAWVARRTHGYWLRHLYESVGVVGGCILDTSVCDMPRVMRMPGTINQKTGRMAKIISQGRAHLRLADKLIALTPTDEFTPPPPPEMMVEGRTYQDVWVLLNPTAKEFIRGGHDEPGRHKATVATVLALRDAGLTPEATMAAVAKGNQMSGPEPLPQRELDRMVRDAFAKVSVLTPAP